MAGICKSSFAGIVICIALILPAQPSSASAVLDTTLGQVTGSQTSDFDQTVESFYGIPFAKAPVGDLRFRAPEPAEPWGSQPRDGTVKPHACWQSIDTAFDRFEGVDMWNPNTERDEDCLYLNVWRRAPQAGDSPKSIMVWIHGGGFYSGSAVLDLYDGTDLAARKDVIVVTIAYRLGPLGFMYLENNSEVPGNAGLLDQVMALKWVKDNAVNLGGSADDITIFGQGAGAVSAGLHMLSPLSNSLFSKVIMQSGSPIAQWAVTDTQETVDKVAKLASKVSCPVSLGDQLLQCLRSVDAQLLTDYQWELKEGWFDVPIGPIVDGVFLPSQPEDMLKAGSVTLTKVIMGYNLNDGIIPALYAFPDILPFSEMGAIDREPFRNLILTVADNDTALQTELLEVYSQEFVDATKRRMRIIDAAIGDSLFKCPIIDFARQYTELGGQVYLYSFEEKLSTNNWPGWVGIPYRSEIETVFGASLNPGSTNTQPEKELTKEMMETWTSFAKTGIPEYRKFYWPLYTTDLEDYVKVRSKGTRSVRRPRKEACAVWAAYQNS
ncbi:hypothetical protein EGW08_009547 [Elysia chlorotica]|uniref:Carboxylesterase type B domain-containing protein n=1 Tax=Elysia chlorotica TaxID=188477 RepID=A0A433TMA9_ELYCH|nr:hypothetical protein EGW08_009547 [Elysia chlorotica]